MFGWIREAWYDVRDAVDSSETWSDFVFEAALDEVWWRYPVCVIDDVFERLRYLFSGPGGREDYGLYWATSLTARPWV